MKKHRLPYVPREMESSRHPNHMVLAILKRPNKRHQRNKSFFQNGPMVPFLELFLDWIQIFSNEIHLLGVIEYFGKNG